MGAETLTKNHKIYISPEPTPNGLLETFKQINDEFSTFPVSVLFHINL